MTLHYLIIGLFILMVLVLFQGLYHMLKTSRDEPENRGKVVKALTWRIGLWVVLFAFIVISKQQGWLEPSESVNPKNYYEEKRAQHRTQTDK